MVEKLVKVGAVSGFPEWLPRHRREEKRLISSIEERFELFGFTPIQTPAAERLDVLTAKGDAKRQIYTLGRPEADDQYEKLALRFDLTVPLARYIVQHASNLTFPFRRYQIEKVWRGEKTQRGRFREFYQCDIDIIGRTSLDPLHDAEIPCVINGTFESLGVPKFAIHLSNLKILFDLLKSENVSEKQKAEILRAVDKSQKHGLDFLEDELAKMRIGSRLPRLVLELLRCKTAAEAKQLLTLSGCPVDGVSELENTLKLAAEFGIPENRLKIDFSIVRGLDYYTGTVYETFIEGKEDWGSVCSGGRYEDLASHYSKQKFPGVGISIGLSRLFHLLVKEGLTGESSDTPTVVLVTVAERTSSLSQGIRLAGIARECGVPTEIYLEPHSLREQLGYASRTGIKFAVFAGPRELANDNVAIRNLEDRTQEVIPLESFEKWVRSQNQSNDSEPHAMS